MFAHRFETASPPRPAAALSASRRIMVPGTLSTPLLDPMSPLALRAKAQEIACQRAIGSDAESLERLFAGLAAATAIADAYPGLNDELGSCIGDVPDGDFERPIARARTEFAVYARMTGIAETIPQLSPAGFVDLLLEIHRRLGKGVNALRKAPVMIRPNSDGTRIVFPPAARIVPLLQDLHGFVQANIRRYPALCAMVAYVGINQAHPFTDGNGRTARTAYNLIMASAGSRHFLPITCFSALRAGSFLVKLRRAMYGGGWDGLLGFFADAARFSDRLQSPSPAAAIASPALSRHQ